MKVYQYRVRKPERPGPVIEQMRMAHEYRNALCRLELNRRRHVDRVARAVRPQLADVEDQIDEAEDALGDLEKQEAVRRQRQGGRQPDDDVRQEGRRLRSWMAGLRTYRQELRRSAFEDPRFDQRMEPIEEENTRRHKAIRSYFSDRGSYWPTRGVVDDAARRMRKGFPPRFLAWGGGAEGWRQVSVQFQKQNSVPALTTDWLVGDRTDHRGHRLLQLELYDDDTIWYGTGAPPGYPCTCPSDWTGEGHYEDCPADRDLRPGVWGEGTNGPRRLGDGLVRIRIGSQRRDPIWATCPIIYHRPLPEGCEIKWAHLRRDRVGTHWRWHLQLVVADVPEHEDLADDGTVGLDVGWRIIEDDVGDRRLRVAVWSGDDGEEGELALDQGWLERVDRIRRIQSRRDYLRDQITDLLDVSRDELPDDLLAPGEKPWRWKSYGRLAALVMTWRARYEDASDAPPGDGEEADEWWDYVESLDWPELLCHLERWRLRDRHLCEYEAQLRDQMQAGRLDLYRKLAAALSRRYEKLVIEDLDLSDFHKLPAIEEGMDYSDDALRAYVRQACLSDLLRTALEQRMSETVEVDPAYTTRECRVCGHVHTEDDWDDRAARSHVVWCDLCGHRWDQDVSAARNLLDTSAEVPDHPPGGARIPDVVVDRSTIIALSRGEGTHPDQGVLDPSLHIASEPVGSA